MVGISGRKTVPQKGKASAEAPSAVHRKRATSVVVVAFRDAHRAVQVVLAEIHYSLHASSYASCT